MEKNLLATAAVGEQNSAFTKQKKTLLSRLRSAKNIQPTFLVFILAVSVTLLGGGVFAAMYVLKEKPSHDINITGSAKQNAEKPQAATGDSSSASKPSETPVPTAKSPSSTPSQSASGSSVVPISDLCSVGVPPTSLNYDSFYQKYCSIRSFSVVSAGVVSDNALKAAAKIIDNMTLKRPDVLSKLAARNVHYGVIGKGQQVLDMPEYRDLYDPNYDWDARSRGFGATVYRPLSSSAEENLLCLSGDRYSGESITVHEFAHTFLNMGLEVLDSGFRGRLQSAYDSAINSGKWANTYAGSNVDEYWAEGVQDFFDTNLQASPANGVHSEINTKAELQNYDPSLYSLITEVFPTGGKITCQ